MWEIPFKPLLGGHGPDLLVKGWEVPGTVFARSGEPNTAFDAAQSLNLQLKNYFGLLYAVPIRAPGTAAFCGEGAAIPLAPHPCFPPQVLANGQPNPDALFLQSGCETGFKHWDLRPIPCLPFGGHRSVGRTKREQFPRPEVRLDRFRRHEEHKSSRLGRGHAGCRVSIF